MTKQKCEPFDDKKTNWFGVWENPSNHKLSSCVINLAEIKKYKGNIRIHITKNRNYNKGENGRPKYVLCFCDAQHDSPNEIKVFSNEQDDDEMFTYDEVADIISQVKSDLQYGVSPDDVFPSAYI